MSDWSELKSDECEIARPLYRQGTIVLSLGLGRCVNDGSLHGSRMFGQAIAGGLPFLPLWWWKRPLFFFISTPKHPFYSKVMLTTTFADSSVGRNTGAFKESIEDREYVL